MTLVQAVQRALIVDTLPSSKQAAGNAWAARMLGIGSVIGFFMYVSANLTLFRRSRFESHFDSGNVDLPKIFPVFGDVEIKILAILAGLFLLTMQTTTATMVKEKILISSPASYVSVFASVYQRMALTRVCLSGGHRPAYGVNSQIFGRILQLFLPLFCKSYVLFHYRGCRMLIRITSVSSNFCQFFRLSL